MGNSRYVLLQGVIRIYDKDKSGNPLQLYIQTEDFKKYVIDNTETTQELFLLIDKEVVVNCQEYSILQDTIPHIIVNKFNVSNEIRLN